MTKHIPKYLVLALLAGSAAASAATHAKPAPRLTQSQRATLAHEAFGAIWMDSDMEDADIEFYVRRALRAGISPDARNEHGDTLLGQAIENNRLGVARMLLQRGADPNLPNAEDGNPPLIRAASGGALPDELQQPQPEVVRLLLRAGAHPNRRNREGSTALMLTVHTGIARMLLARGAQVNARDAQGNTALALAAANGRSNIVAALLRSGADFTLRNKQGHTALKLALALAPVPAGQFIIGGTMPMGTSSDPREIEKEMRAQEQRVQSIERQERQRLTRGRARSARLLRAAGAKQ